MSVSIHGIKSQPHKFVGTSTLAQLEQAGLRQPSVKVDAKTARSLPRAVRASLELHDEVQRGFTKARMENAKAYARYIRAVQTGELAGGTPPINIYVDVDCREASPDGYGLIIPYGAGVVCIDGETQLEARYQLAELDRASAEWPIEVVIWHSCKLELARQYLVDVNTYCTPISVKDAARLDSSGRLTQVVRMVVDDLALSDSDVAMIPDMPGQKARFSRVQLWSAAVGFITGQMHTRRALTRLFEEYNNPLPMGSDYEFNRNAVVFTLCKLAQAVGERGKGMSPSDWSYAGSQLAKGLSADETILVKGHAA